MLNCALLFSYPDCSSFHIEKYQDLPTSRAYAVEHFNINGSLFLAFANFQSNTDDNYNTDSFIYKFNDSSGEFSLYQTIGTNGGRDVEYFTISGEHYLAVANYFNGTTNRLNSVLYRWNGTLFVAFQNIATERGKSFDFFEIAKAPFLAISSYNDVSIYKWKRNMFAKFQEIETGVLRESAAFVINNESYIAFALNRPYSVVYKWSGKNFSHLQNLPGAKDLKPFYVNDHAFLVLAIYGLQKESSIYKWDGIQFVVFQSIPARGARPRGWNPFVICGQTFLAVANQTNSIFALYWFSQGKFTRFREISTVWASDMTSFQYRGHTYLAVASSGYYNQQNIKSMVYKVI